MQGRRRNGEYHGTGVSTPPRTPPPMNGSGSGGMRLMRSNGSAGTGGIVISTRILLLVSVAIAVLFGMQSKTLYTVLRAQRQQQQTANTSLNHLQGVTMHDDSTIASTCRWYLAESAIPDSGLGVFTALGLHKGDTVGVPDICIFVSDAPQKWTHLHSHSFGGGTFFGQYEGSNSRAACEGFTTLYNTAPIPMVNTEMISPVLQTNAGLHRATSPGAGAITNHYGIMGRAIKVIPPGSELTIDYGDWEFEDDVHFERPTRTVEWLQDNGWCIDNIEIKQSTIVGAGRGAFARLPIKKGMTVAPAPLQAFKNRKVFQESHPEQLYINYCLQPNDSTMLFFPYGPVVGLINHASRGGEANVEWRWSTQTNSTRHHPTWLNVPSMREFWKQVFPGGLILEVAAKRDIQVGEEIVIDYGSAWEQAWDDHVATWKPPSNANEYVYPAEMDETAVVRTQSEQQSNPYPDNLGTICATPIWERSSNNREIEWYEPTEWTWWESMTCCHILNRTYDERRGEELYTVGLIFDNKPDRYKQLYNDETIRRSERYIDTHVPRRAIRFIEIPYMDDEHLSNAFRHPLLFPDHLVPDTWRNLMKEQEPPTDNTDPPP